MFRRWLIRTPFILALICVICIWILSHFGWFGLWNVHNRTGRGVGAVEGLVFLGEDRDLEASEPDKLLGADFKRDVKAKNLGVSTNLGFYAGPDLPVRNSVLLIFPLWLPTLLLTALNWFVWQRTRRKLPGRAFPIETSAAPATDTKKTTENTESTETPKHI